MTEEERVEQVLHELAPEEYRLLRRLFQRKKSEEEEGGE